MAQITIQCHLVTNDLTRQRLWKLMAERNTPLINELLYQVGNHPDFEAWRQKGKIPGGVIKQLCQPLRTEPRFAGQPGRFYTSAITAVDYIYKSWLQLQQRLQRRLEGQQRWLEMLKSDTELSELAGCSLASLHQRAAEILNAFVQRDSGSLPKTQKKISRQSKPSKSRVTSSLTPNISAALFAAYQEADDPIRRSAIAYLVKNGCKLPEKAEDPQRFIQRRRKAELRAQRLSEQLDSRKPKGRDLTGDRWLETLEIATTTAPQSEAEARSWQDALLRKCLAVPFPVSYETNTDLTWLRNEQGRICVRFNGLEQYLDKNYHFQVYCDKRQLP